MSAGEHNQTGVREGRAIPGVRNERNVAAHYLDMLRRRIWIVLTIFVVLTTYGVIRVARETRIYEAAARVLVERQSARLVTLEGMSQDTGGWDPEFFKTKAELVKSRAVMELALQDRAITNRFSSAVRTPADSKAEAKRTVIALLGGTPLPPPEAWEILRGHVSSVTVPDTHFVLVRARSASARDAADIANAVARAFEKYHVELQVAMHGDTFDFLRREKEREEIAVKTAEAALQEFREKTKAVAATGSDAEQPPVIKKLNELNRELTDTQLKRLSLSAEAKIIDGIVQDATLDPPKRLMKLLSVGVVRDDSEVKLVSKKLGDAQAKVIQMADLYGPEHPLMKAAQSDQEIMSQEFSQAITRVVQAVTSQIAVLAEKEESLVRQNEIQKNLALEFSKEMFEMTRLDNEVRRHRQMFDMLAGKMSQVDVSGGYLKANVKVVEAAPIPQIPVSPNVRDEILFFVFLGLFLGVGVAVLVEYMDETIKTPEDIRNRLGVPVLGFVPRKETPKGQGRSSADLAVVKEPLSSLAESFRNIRTNLTYASPKGTQIVGFISCGPGEGKTTIATNVAVAFALTGQKTLLLDADFHRSMVDKVLALDNRRGLSNILAGKASLNESIQHATVGEQMVENLDVLCAGGRRTNPGELLGSEAMKALMEQARKQYKWIIFDTPPVLFVSDSSIVSAHCDGVVLIMRAGKHNRSVVNRALEHLQDIRVKVLGSVLNMMVASRFGRYSSDYSYHGYSKYARDYQASYYPNREDDPAGGEGEKKS